MCGLVGMAGDLSGTKKKIFEDLLTVDVVRGPHSTGMGLVERWKESMSVCKTIGPPAELFSLKEYQDLVKATAKVYIGHNRYATTGKINDENAHPFLFTNVLGAHNGTLEYQCRSKLFNSDKFGTDSEAIFSHINHHGFDETIKLIHNPSYNNNAWALSWYNAEHNTINLARNSKRPLFYVYSEDMCTMFWASELDMLRWVLKRNNIKVHDDKSYILTEDNHYSWTIPKTFSDKFALPTISKIEKPEPIEQEWSFRGSHQHGSSTVYHYGGTASIDGRDKHSANVLSFLNKHQKERLTIDTKKWKPPYKDHNGVAIGKARLFEKITDGCTFCNQQKAENFKANFKWGDFVFFLKPDVDGHTIFLCEDCYNDGEIKNLCKELM